tara:strand:+ start:470 stop:1237 length:768 start_codon:yes stop_codon:yes gene_type:complete
VSFGIFIEQIANTNNIDEILIEKLVKSNANIDISTINSLVDEFKKQCVGMDVEELTEFSQTVEQACDNQSERYTESINDILAAISKLMFLRNSLDKSKNPMDIQRFCSELIERALIIPPVIPLLAAFHYIFIATNTEIFSNNMSFRLGELHQSAKLAGMCINIIDSNASQFNDVVKEGNVSPIYRKLESEIKNQVRVLLTNEPDCKQVGARITKWLKETTNNQFILDNAPKKWFKRLIDEEKYFFEEVSHIPIFS